LATGDSSASTNLPPKTIQLQLALQWPKSGSCTLSSNKVFSFFSTSKLKKILQQTGNILISVSALPYFYNFFTVASF